MKKMRTYVKPIVPINYIIRYTAHDDTKHKIMNSNLSEIKKTERYLREKGVKDIDIAVTLPQKPKGSEMFPVNH